MGQVQNGHLYIQYMGSSMKNKQMNAKAYRLHFVAFIAKFTLYVSLTDLKVEKAKHENYNFLLFLLALSCITQKLYHVYEHYTYQITALILEIFLSWLRWCSGKLPP